MSALTFRFFGTGQLQETAGNIIPIRNRKQLALIAYLLMESGHAHSRDSLMALFWADHGIEPARNNLRVALSKLRKLTAMPANTTAQADTSKGSIPLILSSKFEVEINPEADYWFDVAQFSQLLQQTRVHLHANNANTGRSKCAECQPLLEEAASLYQNELLSGLSLDDCPEFEEWLFMQRERQHLLALEAYADLATFAESAGDANGNFEKAMHFAHRQIELDPLREIAYRQQMRILAKQGEQSQALAAFDRCHAVLNDELGVDPEPETLALREQILSREISRQEAPQPNGPIPQPTEMHEALDPVGLQSQPNHNLPQQLTPFIGREAELEQLHERLVDSSYRLISLVGPGGIGKSRLAVQAASHCLNHYADGVFFISLAQLRSSQSIPEAIANALGLIFNDVGKTTAQELIEMLSDKHLLLILDNFEHLVDGVDLLPLLLNQIPGITLLVTSRERLNLQAEDLFMLPGLSVPTERDDPNASRYTAVRLFVDRAHRLDKAFKITPEQLPDVVQICRILDGHPLGIELAATWIRELSCHEIATELTSDFDLLESTYRDGDPQHRSLRTVFDASWQLLSEIEKTLLAQLTVFRGGFTAKSAKAVANGSPHLLAQLSYKSLLRNAGSQRYDMHELVRQFAAQQFEEMDEVLVRDTSSAHSQYFLTMVAEQGSLLHGSDAKNASALIREELDNVRIAWKRAVDSQSHNSLSRDVLSECVQGMGRFYRLTGLFDEGESLLLGSAAQLQSDLIQPDKGVAQLEVAPLKSDSLVLRLKLQGAILQATQKCYEPSAIIFQEIVEAATDSDMLARAYIEWGGLRARQADYAAARTTIQSGLTIARDEQFEILEAMALGELGFIDFQLGNYQEAERQLQSARAIFEEAGNLYRLSNVLNPLNALAVAQNNIVGGLNYLAQLAQTVQQLGDRRGEAMVAHLYSNTYNPLGLFPEAIGSAEKALTLVADLGDRDLESFILHMLCDSYRCIGQLGEAQQAGERALALAEAIASPLPTAFALTYLAPTQAELGMAEQAQESYRRAIKLFQEIEKPAAALEPQAGLAHLLLQIDERAQAMTLVEEILTFLNGEPVMGVDHPLRVYWSCYAVLEAAGDKRAEIILYRGHNLLLEIESKLTDRTMRDAFLKADAANRNLVAAYQRRADVSATSASPAISPATIENSPDTSFTTEATESSDAASSSYVAPSSIPQSPTELSSQQAIVQKLPSHSVSENPSFVGRTREIETVAAMLQNSTVSLLTITGLGGVGKTMLAEELARQLKNHFRDGTHLVSLASTDAGKMQLIGAIAHLFDLQIGLGEEPEEPLLAHLSSQEMLLVLDNYEHLVAEVELLGQIKERAPGITILVTSRKRLNLRYEVIYPLDGLEIPPIDWYVAKQEETDFEQSVVKQTPIYSAVELFVSAAQRLQPSFAVTAENAAAVGQICQLVGGFPLGLELAAAWIRMLDCSEIVAELESNLDLLSSSASDWPERQRTLRGVLEYTWATLSAAEQVALMGLTCFRGSFERKAALEVTHTSLSTLAELMDKSLVQRAEPGQSAPATPKSGRYRLHALIRQFAEEKLGQLKVAAQNGLEAERIVIDGFDPAGLHAAEVANLMVLQATHATYYLGVLSEVGDLLDGPKNRELLPKLRLEDENIQLAYRYVIQKGPIDKLRTHVQAAIPYFRVNGWNLEHSQLIGAAIERLQQHLGIPTLEFSSTHRTSAESTASMMDAMAKDPQEARWEMLSWLMIERAITFNRTGKYKETVLLTQSAIEIAQRLELSDQLIEAHIAWGGALSYMSDSSAHKPLEIALEIIRAENRLKHEATVVGMLGTGHFSQGRFEDARQYYAESVSLARRKDDWRTEALQLVSHGWALEKLGKFEEAKARHEEGYDICQKMSYPTGTARALQGLGLVATAQWKLHEATQRHEEAISIAQKLNDRQREEANRLFAAQALRLAGDFSGAVAHLDMTIEASREINDHLNESLALSQLGMIETAWGSEAKALTTLERALEIGIQLSNIEAMAAAYQGLGWLKLQQAKPEMAEAHFEEELRLRQAREQLYAVIDPQTGLVQSALNQGQNDRAEELCEPILAFLGKEVLHGTTRLAESFWACHQVLSNQQLEEANTILLRARTHLQTVATGFPDQEQQDLFLQNVPIHQQLLAIQ